ncbi:MAG: hypothetical protein IKQ60_10255 [Candidatus Methanomethylophilaceae archaeon]|nr:hypothetical protein [Candidatus Methanomethylophilaceae archaeon]
MKGEAKLFLRMDETRNPGRRMRGETHYIMAGCLTDDIESFEHVTERYGLGKELKFHDHPWLRDEILEDAKPFVNTVYYVQFSKRRTLWDGKGDKRALHRSMLCSLTRGIAGDLTADKIDVVIDHNNLIGNEETRRLVRDVFTLTPGIDWYYP